MSTAGAIAEKFLYEIWKNQEFKKEIHTSDGDKIEILERGVIGTDTGGPDFKNARIKIGNITYVGDVEIDNFYSDWKNHGHHLNPRFNKVILHAVLEDDLKRGVVFTKDGRKVPSVSFFDFIDSSLQDSFRDAVKSESHCRVSKIPCKQLIEMMSETERVEFLNRLGIDRFKKKCERLAYRLKELLYMQEMKIKEPDINYDIPIEYLERKVTYDELNKKDIWNQLLYENVFEALGYSQNKIIMRKLAVAVDVSFLRKINKHGEFKENAESALFIIGGLLNENSKATDDASVEYLRDLNERWLKINNLYDGKYFENEDWSYFRLRPQNFPAIRIAGGVRILDLLLNHSLLQVLIKKSTEIANLEVLVSSIRSVFVIKSDGYWSNHYVFDKSNNVEIKYFVGSSRVDEMLINVILPFLYLYYSLFGKKHYASKILKVLTNIKFDLDNSLIKDVAESLGVGNSSKSALIFQGMIELFRHYCTKDKCEECEIGDKVFKMNTLYD